MAFKPALWLLSLQLLASFADGHAPNIHRDEDGHLHLQGTDVVVNGVSFQALYDMVMRMNNTNDDITTATSTVDPGLLPSLPATFANATLRELDATPDIVRNTSSNYGYVCAADDDYFACSAYGYNRGLIAMYKLNNKESATLQQIILPPADTRPSYFGWALDMDDDLMIVGAYTTGTEQELGLGSAYVYRRDLTGRFVYIDNITDAKEANDHCGYAVAVSGNRFAVSCPGQDSTGNDGDTVQDAGVVHVYTINSANVIEYQAALTHTINAARNDRLGGGSQDCMSMNGNTLVVGMTQHESTTALMFQGGAAVFEYANNKWIETTVLYAPEAVRADAFGYSTAVVNDIILCSAPMHDPNTTIDGSTTASSAGSIFIYMRNSTGFWTFHQRINNKDQKALDSLGYFMDVDSAGNNIIASAHNDDDAEDNGGALHLFSKDANGMFSLSRTILHSDPAPGDAFGYGASFGDGFLVAGAPFAEDNTKPFSHGKAYAFVLQDSD
eukprot:TRINITY_DN12262_c0_g1_i1.p1 TRINITY_DN12262_c0_g1~~TRINITY_DN12262_c0_g1_i1.p1  ORF type:complete len:499 (+),score=94.54 TRINITY_DN12262_c0_g1_i1:781-2277(+)